jgi:hypothetical protein
MSDVVTLSLELSEIVSRKGKKSSDPSLSFWGLQVPIFIFLPASSFHLVNRVSVPSWRVCHAV